MSLARAALYLSSEAMRMNERYFADSFISLEESKGRAQLQMTAGPSNKINSGHEIQSVVELH